LKSRIDSDLALLLRWIVLPLATACAVVGLDLMPLVPGGEPGFSEYALRFSPLIIAGLLLLLAAWLRSQEALDPSNDGIVSRSMMRHLAVYGSVAIAVSLAVRMIFIR
jgi:hypothetical protein